MASFAFLCSPPSCSSTSIGLSKDSFPTFQPLKILTRFEAFSLVQVSEVEALIHFQVAEETSHLAPHGVPSNPIPRALSSSRLNEVGTNQSESYGTYSTVGGNLGVPGANPFAAQQQQQQQQSNNGGYGASY